MRSNLTIIVQSWPLFLTANYFSRPRAGVCSVSPGRPVPDEPARLRILRCGDWAEDEAAGNTNRLGDSDSECSDGEDGYSVFENTDCESNDSMSPTSLGGENWAYEWRFSLSVGSHMIFEALTPPAELTVGFSCSASTEIPNPNLHCFRYHCYPVIPEALRPGLEICFPSYGCHTYWLNWNIAHRRLTPRLGDIFLSSWLLFLIGVNSGVGGNWIDVVSIACWVFGYLENPQIPTPVKSTVRFLLPKSPDTFHDEYSLLFLRNVINFSTIRVACRCYLLGLISGLGYLVTGLDICPFYRNILH